MSVKLSPSEENTLKIKGYRLIKYIGEGAYSKVYLTEFGSPNEQNVIKCPLACKIIDVSKAPKDFVVKFLPRELDVLIRLNHPHLIHCHSIFQRKTKYYIFMRYTENGDLLGYIMKNGTISENQCRIWVHQMSLGIEYLHELEIAHRDLKCENILVTQNLNLKISDFGFARFCVDDSDAPALSETYCGSLSYAAPEILRGRPYALKPVDLWSFGIVLYVMLNRSMPFDDHGLRKLYEDQMCKRWKIKPRVANILSKEVKILLKKILEPDPGLRCKISDVIHSSWIAMDSRLAGMSIVEAAALKRAKEERKKLSDSRRGILKFSSTILKHTPNEVREVR